MSSRDIVSFRSCVRESRGEAKLREREMESVARAQRGKVRRYCARDASSHYVGMMRLQRDDASLECPCADCLN